VAMMMMMMMMMIQRNIFIDYLYRYTVHFVVYLITRTNKCTYIVLNNLNFTLKHNVLM